RLPNTVRLVRPREDLALREPEPRHGLGLPHPLQLPGRSGQRDDHAFRALPLGPHQPAGSGTDRVRENLCRRDDFRLLDVPLGHASPTGCEVLTQPPLELRVDRLLLADNRRHRVAREVVLGRAEPPAEHDEVAARQAGLEQVLDPSFVVPYARGPEHVHADAGEVRGEVRAVRVDDLAEKQLRSDADELRAPDDGQGANAPTGVMDALPRALVRTSHAFSDTSSETIL